ncbi:MAG: Aminomethyltransferase [Fimbriimonadaceae bacterium]|nr:Aminomethyltransferase [Fimbriimonadaceae bacterium]
MCETLENPTGLDHHYRLLRETCGWVDMSHLAFIEITGEDRKGWLQGQVTNDMRALRSFGSLSACMCQPTGQLLAALRIWSLADRYMVLVDRSAVDAVLQRCREMVVMEDVQARAWDGIWVSLQGPTATRQLTSMFELPSLDAGNVSIGKAEAVCLRSNHSGYGGWDLLLPATAKVVRKKILESVEQVMPTAFDIARLETGIPRFGIDTDSKTLPPELGPAFEAQNINYSKGCYTGQEILMRIHSRGHTNRTWMGLQADAEMRAGAKIIKQRQEIGTITSSGFSPTFGPIAAAYIKNEFAMSGEQVEIEGQTADVLDLPFLRFG